MLRKGRRPDDHALEPRRHLLEASRHVHCGADAGEIEASSGADVAVKHFADMQSEPEAQTRPCRIVARGGQRLDLVLGFLRGPQRARADLADLGVLSYVEDREQPVAHELEDFPARRLDRRHETIVECVEYPNQGLRRNAVGELGEAAHVGEPDDGADRFGVSAPDAPRENPLAGLMPDIGVEKIDRGAPQGANLGDPRERRDDSLERLDLRGGEAARSARREGGRVDLSVGEAKRDREIIAHAFSAKLGQKREVHEAIGIGDTAANRLAGRADAGDRAGDKILIRRHGEGRLADARRLTRPPEEAARHDVGMKGVDEDRHPPERHAAFAEANAQLREHVLGSRGRTSAVDQPGRHGADVERRRAPLRLLRVDRRR
jgi:hypothetical protein